MPRAVDARCKSGSLVVDAAGPDTFTFDELLRLLASAVGARVRLVHTPPSLGFALTRLVGLMLRDVVLSREEVDGLMAGLLTSNSSPTGTTRLADWPTITVKSLGGRTCPNGGATTGGSCWPRFRPGYKMVNQGTPIHDHKSGGSGQPLRPMISKSFALPLLPQD